MVERRTRPRSLTLKTAKITAAGDSACIDCAILNIAEGGACILVGNPQEVPQTFALTVDGADALYRCERVWTNGHKIGLTFQSNASGADHE